MKVPKIIQDIADRYGLNSVEYIGKRKGKCAFTMGFIDKDGEPVATGLPVIYLFDGETVEIIRGEEAFQLL